MDATERKALITFREGTSGDSWENKDGWCTSSPLGEWFGVTINDHGSVLKLTLEFNNLIGVIPVEIGELKNLQELNLHHNNLSGKIPPEIVELKNLQILRLYDNKLSGTFPVELCELKELLSLHLSFNQFSGPIPKKLKLLTKLKQLLLQSINLTGVIPVELMRLTNLESLDLANNQLIGPLPKSLGLLINMQLLGLYNNQLTGPIPKELGLLVKLQQLKLNGNRLTGTIPVELGSLRNLLSLYLDKNQLSGAIPAELGGLKDIQILDISKNQLSGPIPKELGLLIKLRAIKLHNNRLAGAIPAEFGGLTDLRTLSIFNNQLSAIGGVEEAQWLLSKFEGRSYDANRFDLRGNPWIMPPEAVVENGLAAVKAYYLDVRMAIRAGAKLIPRQLLKIVLVGSSSAGKTSLMESIISRRANPTEGTTEEASTEGIDVRPHQLGNTSVEFYDCAGQVDYGGMHQVFLTRRALFLLVWDITRCSNLSVSSLDEVIHDAIMRWLYALHLRAPGATVLLVANKCDRTVDNAAETARTVEKRVRIMLLNWKARRGLSQNSGDHGYARPGFEYRPEKNSTDVNLLEGSSLISCENYTGIPALIERVLAQCVSSIKVPPAWELALEFINALRCKRPPVHAASRYLQLPVIEENVGASWSGSFITKEELSGMWRSVVEKANDEMLRISESGVSRLWQGFVRRLTDEVGSISNEAAVNNSDSALEGALQISEFAGQVLLVEDGEGIFLDVVWLSELLTPILSHKLKDQVFPTAALSAMRDDLVEDKILRWEFARYLWRGVLSHYSLQSGDRAAQALYSVLIKLGVIIPLGTTTSATNEGRTLRGSQRIREMSIHTPDMLVLMRLSETLHDGQQRLLDGCTMEALRGACEVTLKWNFDAAGSPYGLVERLIASCHVIGVVQRSLCWRYGALFRSHDITKRFGQNAWLYTVLVRYDIIHDTGDSDTAHVLTVRMIGRLESLRVWAALRYVASAVVILSKEWPGVILKGAPICPKHPRVSNVVYLAAPNEARIGGPLIPEAAPGARNNGCACHLDAGEVLGLVVKQLELVVDIKKDPFHGLPANKTPPCNVFREMLSIWRPYAWKTAIGLWGLALVLFGEITTGVVEEKHALWQVCLVVMILSLMGAAGSSVIVYRDMRRRVAQSSLGLSTGSTGENDVWGDVEAVPLIGSST